MTLTELEALRAARKDHHDLPLSMTHGEANAYVKATADLDRRISQARSATANLAALSSLDDDEQWLAHLNEWRAALCVELLTIKSPIRDKEVKARYDALVWSIRLIDFGFSISPAHLPIVDLSSTRVGVLMQAAGHAVAGDALRGPGGWRGSLKEVEHKVKVLAKERAAAQAVLDDALMDDDARAKREAESAHRREVSNSMRLKHGPDGVTLVPRRADGTIAERSELSDEQRKMLDAFNDAEAAREAARLEAAREAMRRPQAVG